MNRDTLLAPRDHPNRSAPVITVVVEGYNESHDQGAIDDTLEALNAQDYPLDRVHLVLVGSSVQAAGWSRAYGEGTPFASVTAIAADDAHYYELKNRGARIASGEVIVFTDSDVRPDRGWLSALVATIAGGVDVSAGITCFRGARRPTPEGLLRLAASSITYGWIVGPAEGATRTSRGLLAHNVGFRRDVFERHPFATDHGRTCASMLMHSSLVESGARLVLQPAQRAEHYFTWKWWLAKFHFRAGYEVYAVRRLTTTYPNRWIGRTSLFEPLVTMAWHCLFDLPQSLRYMRALGIGPLRRAAVLPLVAGLSILARGAEMAGMFATLYSQQSMRRWAESS